jgi:hypothetical protein
MNNKNCVSLRFINIGLLILFILVSVGYIIFSLAINDYSKLIVSFLSILALLVIYTPREIVKIKIDEKTRLFYLLFIFFGAILGALADLFEIIIIYDKLMHFSSGILLAMFAIIIFRHLNNHHKYSNSLFILFVIAFGSMMAVFWEIGEYTTDLIFGTSAQLGLIDTMNDMISGIIGTILYTIIYMKYRKK